MTMLTFQVPDRTAATIEVRPGPQRRVCRPRPGRRSRRTSTSWPSSGVPGADRRRRPSIQSQPPAWPGRSAPSQVPARPDLRRGRVGAGRRRVPDDLLADGRLRPHRSRPRGARRRLEQARQPRRPRHPRLAAGRRDRSTFDAVHGCVPGSRHGATRRRLIQDGTLAELLSPGLLARASCRRADCTAPAPCCSSGTIPMIEGVDQFADAWRVELADPAGNASTAGLPGRSAQRALGVTQSWAPRTTRSWRSEVALVSLANTRP